MIKDLEVSQWGLYNTTLIRRAYRIRIEGTTSKTFSNFPVLYRATSAKVEQNSKKRKMVQYAKKC